MKAATMPETAHHTKAAQLTPCGAESAVWTSTLSRPMPNPSMVRSTWVTRDMNTPARTACHVQPDNAVEDRVEARIAIVASWKCGARQTPNRDPCSLRKRYAPAPISLLLTV